MAKPRTEKAVVGVASRHERRWREIVESWRSSGLTQGEFCRREGLREGTLSWWKSELVRRDRRRGSLGTGERGRGASAARPVEWLAVEMGPALGKEEPARSRAEGWQFEVVLRGDRRVRLGGDFDVVGLERLIGVLERLPC